MNTMTCNGHDALVTNAEEAELFHGEVMNTRDVITFQGRSVEELKSALAGSVEDDLIFCHERGEAPEKLFPRQFVVRVEPPVHRAAVSAAKREGVSLNKWVAGLMERAVG